MIDQFMVKLLYENINGEVCGVEISRKDRAELVKLMRFLRLLSVTSIPDKERIINIWKSTSYSGFRRFRGSGGPIF